MEPISLGEFMTLLRAQPRLGRVVFDHRRGDWLPNKFLSYRGYYDQLALSHDGMEPPTVASLLQLAEAADGAVFEGYKGGRYTMDQFTPVWAADYGEWPGRAVVGVRYDKDAGVVVLRTARGGI